MQRTMDRLEAFLRRRGRWVVAAWVLLLVAAVPFAARQTEHLTSGGFTVPDSGSEAVDRALDDFEAAEREQLSVVLAVTPEVSGETIRNEIERVDEVAAELPYVDLTDEAERAALSETESAPVTVVPLTVTGDADQTADAAVDLRDELGVGESHGGVQPYLVGQQALWAGMQELSKEDLESAEMTGFPIVLVILLAVFGSLAAAALPLTLGFFSVALTGAAIFFLSQALEMSVFVTNVASMIGIGVAVDYSLFVLARYREEIHAGADPGEARRVALRTSGLAVAFSGVTVMIALAGLWLVESTTIRSMALGAIIVVAVSVLAAITLLPVLIRLLGRRAYSRGRPWLIGGLLVRAVRSMRRRPGATAPDRPRRQDFWTRWTARVMRRPVVATLVSAAVLLTLAVPALSLEWGDGALRQFPEGNETRRGAELAAEQSGPGAAGPVQIVAELDGGAYGDAAARGALRDYSEQLRADPEVAAVARPTLSEDGASALIAAVPQHDPESPEARALVDRIRAEAGSGEGLASMASIAVGGATASVEDFKDLVSGSMWKILLFVLVLSYLVLLVLLRSVLLPLKAVLMNLLSVAAAYGVLVAIFQWGWLDGFLGFESLGYINTMTPPLLLAIVFGLSMDYEVFLLSRIRERYDVTGDTKRAVAEGLRASARTISSAALIMVAVFAVFAGTGVPSIKEIGLGLAVAIALDATLVRLVLVPAVMELMGDWNWWLPRPLARVLPHTELEGSGATARAEGSAA
jgi:RND superfamily putative drug exporter